MGDFLDSWKTSKPQKSARISFARAALASAACQALAVAQGAVRSRTCVDPARLLGASIDRAEGGGIVFPFDAVKVEFLLKAA
jgi:hypothetical protein